jgi:hypothetical protein
MRAGRRGLCYRPDAQESATQLVIRQAELMAEGAVRE